MSRSLFHPPLALTHHHVVYNFFFFFLLSFAQHVIARVSSRMVVRKCIRIPKRDDERSKLRPQLYYLVHNSFYSNYTLVASQRHRNARPISLYREHFVRVRPGPQQNFNGKSAKLHFRQFAVLVLIVYETFRAPDAIWRCCYWSLTRNGFRAG